MKALLQTEPAPLPTDALVSAFETVERFTRHDAARIAEDARGVLIERLSAEEAHDLKTALGGQGHACEVVDQADITALPEPFKARQIEASDDGLIVYDTLDRPQTYPWDTVAVVGAGRVRVTEFERKSKVTRTTSEDPPRVEVRYEEGQVDRVLLDLLVIVKGQLKRFRAFSDEFRYGPDVTPQTRETTFGALIGAIAERAVRAEKTSHLDAMASGHFLGAKYTRRGYQNELTWRLYRWGWHPSDEVAAAPVRRPLRSGTLQQRRYASAVSGALGGPLMALGMFGDHLSVAKILLCVAAAAVAGYFAPAMITGNTEWK